MPLRLVGVPFFDKYGELTVIARQQAGSLVGDIAACYYSPKLKFQTVDNVPQKCYNNLL